MQSKAAAAVAIVAQSYDSFLALLSDLISTRTVTTDEDALSAGVEFCRSRFAASLEPLGWSVGLDPQGNVECIPPPVAWDLSAPVLWLCAHVDTVPAVAMRWEAPDGAAAADPFTARHCATHLTGRGANDCQTVAINGRCRTAKSNRKKGVLE